VLVFSEWSRGWVNITIESHSTPSATLLSHEMLARGLDLLSQFLYLINGDKQSD
jgi:hypothetical protein